MIGIELVSDRDGRVPIEPAKLVEYHMKNLENRLITYCSWPNTMGLLPPLIVDRSLVDEMVSIMDKTFRAVN